MSGAALLTSSAVVGVASALYFAKGAGWRFRGVRILIRKPTPERLPSFVTERHKVRPLVEYRTGNVIPFRRSGVA